MFRLLSVFDTIALLLGPGQDTLIDMFEFTDIENINNRIYKAYWPIRCFSWAYPGWVLVFITLEKCIRISRPFDAAIVCSKEKIKKWLVITGSLLMLIYSPNAIYKMKWTESQKLENYTLLDLNNKYIKTDGECVSIPTDYPTNTLMTTMLYVDFVIAALLPFIIMFSCNGVIIYHLVENKQNTKKYDFNRKWSGFSEPDQHSPGCFIHFYYFDITQCNSSNWLEVLWYYKLPLLDSIKLCRSFSKTFLIMNNSLNFVQYVCTGQRFRRASTELIDHMLTTLTNIRYRFMKPPIDNVNELNVIE